MKNQKPDEEMNFKSSENTGPARPADCSEKKEDTASMESQCAIVQDLIPLYTDGIASSASAKLIEKHVRNCADCADKLSGARQDLQISPDQQDQKMESALRGINRKLYRHRIIFGILLTLCMILLIFSSSFIVQDAQVSADNITIDLYSSSGKQKTLEIHSQNGPLVGMKVQNSGNGEYYVSAYLHRENRKSEKTVVLSDPVHSIYFNQDLVWQDGITITPRCRHLEAYMNGFAGSTQQMDLARPEFPGMEFHIEADTSDPEHCIWTYVSESGNLNRDAPDSAMMQGWKQNALLALALTPDLQEIQLQSADRKTLAQVSRSDLKKILDEKHISANVSSLRDLQQILDAVEDLKE